MGDRIFCSLTLYGRMTNDEHEKFAAICAPLSEDEEDNYFAFPEMNYGEMPAEVYAALKELNVAYVWAVDGTSERLVCRLLCGREVTLSAIDGEIVIPFDQMDNKDLIADAKAVKEMVDDTDFRITGVHTAKLTYREHATVLAALRYYQNDLRDDGEMFVHGDISTDGGTLKPLTVEEIDTLCERIN